MDPFLIGITSGGFSSSRTYAAFRVFNICWHQQIDSCYMFHDSTDSRVFFLLHLWESIGDGHQGWKWQGGDSDKCPEYADTV